MRWGVEGTRCCAIIQRARRRVCSGEAASLLAHTIERSRESEELRTVLNTSIHSLTTRLAISIVMFVVLLLLIVPHLLDAQLPLIVEVLLKPAFWMDPILGRFLPHPNIGTPAHPVYEGTPLDLLLGFALAFLCILLYPLLTFIGLSLLSRMLRRRAEVSRAR
jgi:hypothetical protein